MVGFSEVLCTNCNFKIIVHGVDHFYIDYKTDKLKEFMWLMRTEIDWNNEIFGHIHRTYCPSCDKIIKTYIITKSKYSKEESIHKLENILKKSDINENDNIFYITIKNIICPQLWSLRIRKTILTMSSLKNSEKIKIF